MNMAGMFLNITRCCGDFILVESNKVIDFPIIKHSIEIYLPILHLVIFYHLSKCRLEYTQHQSANKNI